MYDVIVIGAGPSGALAAYALARNGRKVLLLDRATFPRHKVCGDCLNPRIHTLMESLGLWEGLQQLPHHIIRGITLQQDGKPVFRHMWEHSSFLSIARSELDYWLIQKAQGEGVAFLGGTAVKEIDAGTGQVTSEGMVWNGAIILGADGRNSSVAREAGLTVPSQKCGRVGWQTTLDIPGLDDTVQMNVFEGGYYGLVKINARQANLCMVLESKTGLRPREILDRFWPGQPANDWHSIHPIRRTRYPVVRNKVWLVGDASCVVEPFTGEGIYFAMASAKCAADVILKSNELVPEELGRKYQQAHAGLYRGELLVNQVTRWFLEKSSRGMQALAWLKNYPMLLRYATEHVLLGAMCAVSALESYFI